MCELDGIMDGIYQKAHCTSSCGWETVLVMDWKWTLLGIRKGEERSEKVRVWWMSVFISSGVQWWVTDCLGSIHELFF